MVAGLVFCKNYKKWLTSMAENAKKYDVFQAIADPTRRQVLKLLSEKERPIAEIAEEFSISRNAVVKHLDILTQACLIKGTKIGRNKVYQLNPEPLQELSEWLSYYEQFWNNKLSILKYTIEKDNGEG